MCFLLWVIWPLRILAKTYVCLEYFAHVQVMKISIELLTHYLPLFRVIYLLSVCLELSTLYIYISYRAGECEDSVSATSVILKSDNKTEKVQMGPYCGTAYPGPLVSEWITQRMLITFKSSSQVTLRGFQAKYEFIYSPQQFRKFLILYFLLVNCSYFMLVVLSFYFNKKFSFSTFWICSYNVENTNMANTKGRIFVWVAE